jgi:lipopolysaccharide export system protein LptA
VTRQARWVLTSVFGLSLLLTVPAAAQQTLGLGPATAGKGAQPVHISADNGIEWRQAQHVYIARGNVKAVRGQVTLYADELRAYYRPTAKNLTQKAAAAKAAPPAPAAKPRKPGGVNLDEGPTEVYRLEAIGHVRFVTPTQTAYGDHADYDVDTARLVMTGTHLKAVSQHDTLTARDSLEWYDKRQLGVARGHAVDYHDGKTIAADVLMATMVHDKGQPSHISRLDAHGHVVVVSSNEIARGDEGVYNAATGIVTLSGHVRLTRGKNEMSGAYGVVDLNRNVGQLLPAPPGERRVAGSPLRVEGLIMPTPTPAPAGAGHAGAHPPPPPRKPPPPSDAGTAARRSP